MNLMPPHLLITLLYCRRVNSIDWPSPQYIAFKRNLRTMETLSTLMDLT
uniref:Uncharacterized protein n=1 Tax=Medicago truncatula TaxID=3880 RepID=I3S4U5_MEDTR|nr:unknown [Medicago truncatula]